MRRVSVLVLLLALGSTLSCDRIEELKERFLGSGGAGDQEPAELKEARELIEAGQFQQAVPGLEAFVQQDPTSAQAFYYLGQCHLGLAGDEVNGSSPLTPEEEKSREAFNRALSLNPRHGLAAVGLGDLYARRVPSRRPRRRRNLEPSEDPYQLAMDAYQKAVTIDPKLPEGQMSYARFLARTGQLEEAEQAFRAAAEAAATIPEKAPDTYIAYGRFLTERGRLQEAVDQYELAQMFRQEDQAVRRDIATLHTRMGLEYFENEQYALAEKSLNTAYQMFPDKNDPEAQKASTALQQLKSIRGR